ncbi:MAG: OmpA family protein [Flavobacteriaceae bacterium]|nr:OmpA family protein [Flavobacteriaceae bacterium]
MKAIKLLIAPLVLILALPSYGQETIPMLTAKDSVVASSWMVSLGTNIVDDSGDEFGNLFDVGDSWNMVPFPSRISVGRYFENGLGLEAIGSFNRYKEGKIVDGDPATEDIDYYAIDFRASYDLNSILGETGWFDPYVGIGAGYTDANNEGRGTYNATVGFRTWFSDHWGLDFNSSGKWAMSTENATNHIQHAVGLVYQFDVEKKLSRKGQEKLALIQEMEAEQQRIQDSIASAQKAAEDAQRVADELARQQEADRLAAEERMKEEAEKARRKAIEDEIADLGNVYFPLNSSYLTSSDKDLLDRLAAILDRNKEVRIKITSHTDSRGSDTYNNWLSERRLDRTVQYLLSKNIERSRVTQEAFGETKLVNECADRVPCPESKHRQNRRSEFLVLWN